MNKKIRVYYVEWVDSASLSGWKYLDSSNDGPSTIVSVGLLVRESKDHITLSTSVSECNSVMDPLSIPRFAITKMRKVRL